MTRAEILESFQNLNQWRSGDKRAPHKPLLALYAIGKLLRGEDRLISYTDDIGQGFKQLLWTFGSSGNPYIPFWRLQSDGIWEVTHRNRIRLTSSGDPHVTDLRRYNVSGGFTDTVFKHLQTDFELTFEIIQFLLDDNFTPSLHQDILQAVGIGALPPLVTGIQLPFQLLETGTSETVTPSWKFCRDVLRAYQYRCAVCSFDVRLEDSLVGVEACHIKWQNHNGPNDINNGLALCSLHQRLFDRGVLTLSTDYEVLISEYANGSVGFEEWLMRFHGKTINTPQRACYYPDENYINWHLKEVFKNPARDRL